MNKKEFKQLERGDLVCHATAHDIYIVTANYGDRITAIRSQDLTNPREWELVAKATYEREKNG